MTQSLDIRLCDLVESADQMLEMADEHGIHSLDFLEEAVEHSLMVKKRNYTFLCAPGKIEETPSFSMALSGERQLFLIVAQIAQSGSPRVGQVYFHCKSEVLGYHALPYGKLYLNSRRSHNWTFENMIAAIKDLRGCQ
jgi:hypothetical protein